MTKAVFAIDPGVRYAAWVALDSSGSVHAHGRTDWGECRSMAEAVCMHGYRIVVERPRVYAGGPRQVEADVRRLGEVVRAFLADFPKAEAVEPVAWKGNVPKAVAKKRMTAAGWPDMPTHDEQDALGIALYASGRMGRGMTRRKQ